MSEFGFPPFVRDPDECSKWGVHDCGRWCVDRRLIAIANKIESAEKAWWENKVTEYSVLRPPRGWYVGVARELMTTLPEDTE